MSPRKLAIGTAQFGQHYGIANERGQVSKGEASQIVGLARDSGIDTLDTAISYGSSESCLGEIGTAGFKVITKLPPLPDAIDDSWPWIEQHVRAACQRLGQSTLYGLLLHRSQDLLGRLSANIVGAFKRSKVMGLVQKTGISVYSPDELTSAMAVGSIDIVQAPLSVIDTRMVTSGWLGRLHEQGIEVHTRSAFLQGLLLMPRHRLPSKFEQWSVLWDRWQDYLQEFDLSATAACLSYPMSLSQVYRVVVGVDTAEQLRELIAVAGHPPPVVDWPDMCSLDERLINPSKWMTL